MRQSTAMATLAFAIGGTIVAAQGPGSRESGETKIIPGHGPLGDRAALKAYRDMMAGVRDKILPLVKAGKSAADVVAARPAADFDAQWGKGFLKADDFVKTVYQSLTAAKP